MLSNFPNFSLTIIFKKITDMINDFSEKNTYRISFNKRPRHYSILKLWSAALIRARR